VSEPVQGDWPTADAVAASSEPVTDGHGVDPANRATYHREHVVATLAAVEDHLADSERLYTRARDLEEDADADPRTIGGILALVCDAPEVIESEYGIEPEVSVARWGEQPAGTVWEVTRRA
jgi:hypothetical protein